MLHAAEAEILSIIPSALNPLASECAKSFRMFLDGYDIKEIARMLGKKEKRHLQPEEFGDKNITDKTRQGHYPVIHAFLMALAAIVKKHDLHSICSNSVNKKILP